MTQAKKKGAPPVGLYIKVGPSIEMDFLTRDLKEIFFTINSGPYERNMHALEIRGDTKDPAFKEQAETLCALAKNNGFACIMRGEATFAKKIGAEGVLLDDFEQFEKAKTIFGDKGIIGLNCGTSKEKAAQAHDLDADFVSFGTQSGALPDPETLRFWTILSDKPALVEGAISNDYCAYLIEKGASFIDAADYIWSHGKGVMQGTVNMMHAIDLALESIEQQGQA